MLLLLAKRRTREENLQSALDEILKREEILWRDKAKMAGLEDGDANTRYFHLSTIIRRRYNNIDFLLNSSNSWITDWSTIGSEFVDSYSSLFSSDCPNFSADLEGLILPSISDSMNVALVAIPTLEEIKLTVFTMSAHTSPGPDGFPPLFFLLD